MVIMLFIIIIIIITKNQLLTMSNFDLTRMFHLCASNPEEPFP